jgi:hypothetical protein
LAGLHNLGMPDKDAERSCQNHSASLELATKGFARHQLPDERVVCEGLDIRSSTSASAGQVQAMRTTLNALWLSRPRPEWRAVLPRA